MSLACLYKVNKRVQQPLFQLDSMVLEVMKITPMMSASPLAVKGHYALTLTPRCCMLLLAEARYQGIRGSNGELPICGPFQQIVAEKTEQSCDRGHSEQT